MFWGGLGYVEDISVGLDSADLTAAGVPSVVSGSVETTVVELATRSVELASVSMTSVEIACVTPTPAGVMGAVAASVELNSLSFAETDS